MGIGKYTLYLPAVNRSTMNTESILTGKNGFRKLTIKSNLHSGA